MGDLAWGTLVAARILLPKAWKKLMAKYVIMFRHLVCTGREVLGHDIEFWGISRI